MPGAGPEEQQAALELLEYRLASSCTNTLGGLERQNPGDLMLFLSTALLRALNITMSLKSELYENSKAVSSPSLGSITGTYHNSD